HIRSRKGGCRTRRSRRIRIRESGGNVRSPKKSQVIDSDLWAPRRGVHTTIVCIAASGLAKECPRAAAQAGLAITEYVPREAHPRRHIVPASFDTAVWNTRVAVESSSRRSQWEALRVDTCEEISGRELLVAVTDIDPRTGWFPTNAEV